MSTNNTTTLYIDPALAVDIESKVTRRMRLFKALMSTTPKKGITVCGIKLITRASVLLYFAIQSEMNNHETGSIAWFYLRDWKYNLVEIKPIFQWENAPCMVQDI